VETDAESAATVVRRGDTYGGLSRQERESDRRERILTAALHLFAARDYDDVTVADVCAGAKVSKRYFYDYFSDREDLLLQLHREQNDWLMNGIVAAVPKQPESVEQVFRPAMTALVQLLLEHPERGRVVYINAPHQERRRRGLMRKDAEAFGRLIRRAIGRPRDKVRFDRLLLALAAGVTEVIIDWLATGMTGAPDVLVDHLTGLGVAMLGDAQGPDLQH
jgi:AcrR family transcriptional regulator